MVYLILLFLILKKFFQFMLIVVLEKFSLDYLAYLFMKKEVIQIILV
jgi:hypothetical protein